MYQIIRNLSVVIVILCSLSGCTVLRENSKYKFNDGIYQTSKFTRQEVYVMHVDDDTIAVFPVKTYKDSVAILTQNRMSYTAMQSKFKDKKTTHTFYRPSADFDVMTIPLNYRPPSDGLPNQLNTNFNGAIFGGYRIDEYKLKYERTPLKNYKQEIQHKGYSMGLYLGVGSTAIDPWVMTDPKFTLQYEGATLISGIAANMSTKRMDFGIAFGVGHLLDKYSSKWIYEGKPCVGFTVGLNLDE